MLRIEFKKLRYTMEYFAGVMGKHAVEAIEGIKSLQDHLGDLNDASVASKILSDYIKSREEGTLTTSETERQGLDEVMAYLKFRLDERERLQRTFFSAWNMYFQNRAFRRNISQAVSVL
jgi:CHAD domain-containing protein